MLEQIRANGFARVQLTAGEVSQLDALYKEAMAFFSAGEDYNIRYSSDPLTNGYRPYRSAYNNGDPVNEDDLNDSFLYWSEEAATKIPEYQDIGPFLRALKKYRSNALTRVMGMLISELAAHYDYQRELTFQRASVLQINSFGRPSSRDLLQTSHEDGVLATVIWTSAPGLEALVQHEVVPLTPTKHEVLVMPGGILELMTGGEIGALYHQARNLGLESLDRTSIMFFSCPDFDKGPIEPYVVNDVNRNTDIAEYIQSATDVFGLPPNFFNGH